jgi:hypothetical protein
MIRLLLPERYCIMKITASRKLRNRMWVVELLQLLLGPPQSEYAGILTEVCRTVSMKVMRRCGGHFKGKRADAFRFDRKNVVLVLQFA